MPQKRKYSSGAERQAAYRKRCAAKREAELQSKGLPPLPPVPSIPGHRRWDLMIRQARFVVEQVKSEMESYYIGRSDDWNDSERGEAFAELMESVEEAASALREVRY